jgi:hypothetical protein
VTISRSQCRDVLPADDVQPHLALVDVIEDAVVVASD